MNSDISNLISLKEDQLLDFKSARIDPHDLADSMMGFANADGGRIVVGIEDDKTISGFRGYPNKLNQIKESIPSWVRPPIRYSFKNISFSHQDGVEDYVLVIEIDQSPAVHSNNKDEVYLRCGTQNQKLNFETRQQLVFDKGLQRFEARLADGVNINDLDKDLIEKFATQIGMPSSSLEDVLLARNLGEINDGGFRINFAGLLLFGISPQKWIELARIRILRYEGVTEKTGGSFNVVKDERIEGSIINQIENTKSIISSIVREFTKLNEEGKFVSVPEYPPFAWLEGIVNAVTHREYSLFGADIQVKIFDDRIEIISPGNFPSIVKEHNIKHIHFSRNPKIARVLSDLGYIKELGEGVNRMYEEMAKLGLPEPKFENPSGIVSVKLFNNVNLRSLKKDEDLIRRIYHPKFSELSKDEKSVMLYTLENTRITTREAAKLLKKSNDTALALLKKLKGYSPSFILDVRKGPQDPNAFYQANPQIFVEDIPRKIDVDIRQRGDGRLF